MWKEGSIKIHDSIFHYWMKQYDKGSEYGIDGGRISKLMIKCEDRTVCNYDRGWDVKPETPDAQLALEIILHGDNY